MEGGGAVLRECSAAVTGSCVRNASWASEE